MAPLLHLQLLPLLMHRGYVKISWSCLGCSTPWSVGSPRSSATHNHLCISGNKLKRCMAIKTMPHVSSNSRKISLAFSKRKKPLYNTLGSLTSMWNELDVYRPHTTDATVLTKRAEEDKIFQLLASLGPEYEDLRSHILMNTVLPSFTGVCAIIQREEVRKKVMSQEIKATVSETKAYVSSNYRHEGKVYKGKRPECSYCDTLGHTRDKYWILHPELKPKSFKETKGPQRNLNNNAYKVNHAATSSTEGMMNFTANPCCTNQ